MKLSYHRLSAFALVALAGGITGITPSTAAVVAAPVSGDVFLAFRAGGGTGGSTSYLINLGQASQFANAAPDSTFTLNSVGNIGADLIAAYGANWNTRSDLFWGIFGATDSVNPTLYASQERSSGTSTAWPQLTQQARTSVKTEILSVTSGVNGYLGRDATANSAVGTFQANSGQSSSYNFQVTGGATDFGSQSQWSSIEGDFGDGVANTTLDFYRIRNASPTVSLLGSFNIDNSGSVSFTAIPEPSAILLGAVGALLLVTNRRRA